jgi:hypothetical protein
MLRTMTSTRYPALAAVLAVVLLGCLPSAGAPPPPIDFNRDVRPILSDNCFRCHGPDTKESSSGRKPLRLDARDHATAALSSGARAIVPGRPEASELVRRITTPDADDHMPPAETGKKLTPQNIATLRRWIQEGAEYARHWAYVPPVRPAVPRTRGRARQPIDAFIPRVWPPRS